MRNRLYTSLAVALVTTLLSMALPSGTALADDPPRYQTYYSIFSRNHNIPYLNTNWVPQGLAYWPETDEMVLSYYDDNGGRARLTFLDRATSARHKSVYLDASVHAATLTMSKSYLWVSASSGSKTQVLRYAKSAFAAAADGAQVTRNKLISLKASSVMEIEGSKLYIGSYHTDTAGTIYRYQLDANEDPAAEPDESFSAPSQLQGMTITPDYFVWSRSGGRDNDSELAVDPRHGAITKRVVAPNMSEDLAIANGEVYVVYESGAKKYSDADYIVHTIHRGPVTKLVS